MLKAKGARWLVAVVVAAAGLGLTGCEAPPREGTGADKVRDYYHGCDTEPDPTNYDGNRWNPMEPC